MLRLSLGSPSVPSIEEIVASIAAQQKPKRKPVDGHDKSERDKFYASKAWKSVRYKILVRDGAKCAACGRTPADGVKLACDHIKPLALYWDLRLDPSNLQILCSPDCNLYGKGRNDTTDFRPKETRDAT
jgi:5-methylcytosine-specific restriction endonuclease McrA